MQARLDFDEDLPELDERRLRGRVEEAQVLIEAALKTARQGTLLRQGLQVRRRAGG